MRLTRPLLFFFIFNMLIFCNVAKAGILDNYRNCISDNLTNTDSSVRLISECLIPTYTRFLDKYKNCIYDNLLKTDKNVNLIANCLDSSSGQLLSDAILGEAVANQDIKPWTPVKGAIGIYKNQIKISVAFDDEANRVFSDNRLVLEFDIVDENNILQFDSIDTGNLPKEANAILDTGAFDNTHQISMLIENPHALKPEKTYNFSFSLKQEPESNGKVYLYAQIGLNLAKFVNIDSTFGGWGIQPLQPDHFEFFYTQKNTPSGTVWFTKDKSYSCDKTYNGKGMICNEHNQWQTLYDLFDIQYSKIDENKNYSSGSNHSTQPPVEANPWIGHYKSYLGLKELKLSKEGKDKWKSTIKVSMSDIYDMDCRVKLKQKGGKWPKDTVATCYLSEDDVLDSGDIEIGSDDRDLTKYQNKKKKSIYVKDIDMADYITHPGEWYVFAVITYKGGANQSTPGDKSERAKIVVTGSTPVASPPVNQTYTGHYISPLGRTGASLPDIIARELKLEQSSSYQTGQNVPLVCTLENIGGKNKKAKRKKRSKSEFRVFNGETSQGHPIWSETEKTRTTNINKTGETHKERATIPASVLSAGGTFNVQVCVDTNNKVKEGSGEHNNCTPPVLFYVEAPVVIPAPQPAPQPVVTPPSTPVSSYSVRMHNIDDVGTIFVNGAAMLSASYNNPETGWVSIEHLLQTGANTVRFQIDNHGSGWTYGFGLKQDDAVLWSDACGTRSVVGCNNNDGSTGTVYVKEIEIQIPDPTTTPQPTPQSVPPVNPTPVVDLVTHSLSFVQVPTYAGDVATLTFATQNDGTIAPTVDSQTSVHIQCDADTQQPPLNNVDVLAADLLPSQAVWNKATLSMPNLTGSCSAVVCANATGDVTEAVDNNCSALDFSLLPQPPMPQLSIRRFEDERGCCTTNRGDKIEPHIWVFNGGTVAPASNVLVLYQVRSPVATNNQWMNIGYGTIKPSELQPGDTDEDQLDSGGWRIPDTPEWLLQWHHVRAWVHPQGKTPVGDQAIELVTNEYGRYSKK